MLYSPFLDPIKSDINGQSFSSGWSWPIFAILTIPLTWPTTGHPIMGSHTDGLPGAIKPGKYSSQTHSTLHKSVHKEIFFVREKKVPLLDLKLQIYFYMHRLIYFTYMLSSWLDPFLFLMGDQALPYNANRNFLIWREMWASCLWSSCAVSKSWHVGWARRRLWRCTSTRALIQLFSHNIPFYEKKFYTLKTH